MPKKTREEKILARLRRLEQNSREEESSIPEVEKTTVSKGFNLRDIQKTQPAFASTQRKTEKIDYSYVKKDLRKTLIITAAALLAEVVLSLTLGHKF